MTPLRLTDVNNRLLGALSPKELAGLSRHLELFEAASGDVLEVAGDSARFVYFPVSGVISLLAPLEQGGRVEVGHTGREGVAGVHAALGADLATSDMVAQCETSMLRADVATIRREIDRNSGLGDALVQFANAFHVQVAQTAACNGSHEVVQRLARWLLMSHDRADGDTLTLTHESVSQMLGVTRPGVTIAAGALQKAGLISYSRGKLEIVDRAGLERTACECYGIVASYYESELKWRRRT